MPCIAANCRAVNVPGYRGHVARKKDLHDDDCQQNPKCVGLRQRVRNTDQRNTFARNCDTCRCKGQADESSRNRLSLSMSVGMLFVRWPDRDTKSEIYSGGTKHIRERFDPVGHERKRMTEESSQALAHGQKKVRHDADERRLQSSSHLLLGIEVHYRVSQENFNPVNLHYLAASTGWFVAANSQHPIETLLSEPVSPGAQAVYVVEDDLDGGCQGDRKDEYHGSPEPSPEEQGERYGEGI